MTTLDSDRRVAVVTGASAGIGEATARTLLPKAFTSCAWRAAGAPIKERLWPRNRRHRDCGRRHFRRGGGGARRRPGPGGCAGQQCRRGPWLGAGARGGPRPLAVDVGVQRARHAAGDSRTAAQADRPGDGLVVTVTSIAALETYDNGSGYASRQHAQGALHPHARGELLGKPVRLTEVAPGMVKTDFSLLRFDGDQDRADSVYRGVTPLVAKDVAEVIGFRSRRGRRTSTST